MPHLSPMSWMTMLMFSTMMILILNSISWWKSSIKFPSLTHSLYTSWKPWSW